MKKIALLLLYSTCSYAASLPPSRTETLPSANVSLPTTPLSNLSSALLTLPQTHILTSGIERFEYRIPDTLRTLIIAIDRIIPINPSAFHRVITSILYNLRRHIDNNGDGPLLPHDNPYQYSIRGCQSTTFSRTGFGTLLLTYGMLKEVMHGLRVVLEAQRRFYVAAYAISDEHGIVYGEGQIEEGGPASGPE